MKKMMFLLLIAALVLLTLTFACAEEPAWQPPCIDAPYDHTYQDESRSIVIRSFSQDDCTYYVADVQLCNADGFMAITSSPYEPLSTLGQEANAVLAINSDDYATHKYGVIIRNGEVLRTRSTTRHMLTVDAQGDLGLITDRKNMNASKLAKQLIDSGVRHTFEFGPALVEDGYALVFPKSFDLISTRETRKEPRTAIGQIGPLHYILIVVDGRQPGYSDGISLQGLQQLMLQYGAQTAFNLDGGGSAEMWFMGEIVNHPSGDHERSMSDAICF